MQSDHLTLNLLIRGFQVSRILRVVADLGVADEVPQVGACGVGELARSCSVLSTPLTRLLRALAAFSVFRITPEGQVSHTKLSLLLRTDHPDTLRPAALALTAQGSWRAWGVLDVAMTGEVPHQHAWNASRFDYLRDHPGEGRNFDLLMSRDPSHGAVAAAYDFAGAKLIADIGGGNGALLRTILSRNLDPCGLVFDRKDVISAIDSADLLGGRIKVEAGNFFDDVPRGASHYLLARVLHDWPDTECLSILRRCHAAMSVDARLLIVEQILDPDPSNGRPLQYLSDMQMMAMFGGARERTLTEYRELLQATGFALTRVVDTSSSASIMEATAVLDAAA
jgi:hypothetical protein